MAPSVALGEELVRRGHNVTLFTAQIKNYDRPRKTAEEVGMRYTSVDVNVTYEAFEAATESISLDNESSSLTMFRRFSSVIGIVQSAMQDAEGYLDGPLLRNYDVILATEFAIPVAMCASKKWDVPVIFLGTARQLFPHQLPPWPHPVGISHRTDNLDFMGRLYETLQRYVLSALFPVLIEVAGLKLKCPHEISTLAQAPGVLVPHIVPTVIGFEYPRSISPLVTYTGPILSPRSDPLPGDLRVWLDGRPPGSVVYVSMGSVAFISRQTAVAILEGLNATGRSAVWSLRKKNRDVLEGVELDNEKVFLSDWAPQLAILRHAAVGMAILHGGMNGVQEALHSGVPIIALPVGGDQLGNAVRVVHHGLGIHLDPRYLTGVEVAEGIRTIESGNYRERVNKIRKVFRHAGGVVRAADLVELYAEVGYGHLIPAYARYEWTWIQYYNVDVYAVFLVVGGLVVWILSRLCRCVCIGCGRCIVRGKQKEE